MTVAWEEAAERWSWNEYCRPCFMYGAEVAVMIARDPHLELARLSWWRALWIVGRFDRVDNFWREIPLEGWGLGWEQPTPQDRERYPLIAHLIWFRFGPFDINFHRRRAA